MKLNIKAKPVSSWENVVCDALHELGHVVVFAGDWPIESNGTFACMNGSLIPPEQTLETEQLYVQRTAAHRKKTGFLA